MLKTRIIKYLCRLGDKNMFLSSRHHFKTARKHRSSTLFCAFAGFFSKILSSAALNTRCRFLASPKLAQQLLMPRRGANLSKTTFARLYYTMLLILPCDRPSIEATYKNKQFLHFDKLCYILLYGAPFEKWEINLCQGISRRG